MKKYTVTTACLVFSQVFALSAWALPTCDFIQVECLPSVKQVQLKVHPQDCTKAWWYTSDELARYEADNIYRPYEHHKAYERSGRKSGDYTEHPQKPRNFICNMGENTIQLELGVTRPDPKDYDCQSSYGYLPYMKWMLNGEKVSEKLYFNNVSNCLEGKPFGTRAVRHLVAEAYDSEALVLDIIAGWRPSLIKAGYLIGSSKKPISYEDLAIKPLPANWQEALSTQYE